VRHPEHGGAREVRWQLMGVLGLIRKAENLDLRSGERTSSPASVNQYHLINDFSTRNTSPSKILLRLSVKLLIG